MAGAATEYIANQEYRSDDWFRLPKAEDFHSWKEIEPFKNKPFYGDAVSDPAQNRDEMCSW
jgi:hypothetical protein